MDIFVSRPTWVPSEFEAGLETFLLQMINLGLKPRTLGVSDYPNKSPLDEVIEIMASCQGAVVLGYPQIEVCKGLVKGDEIAAPVTLGTEWNHLEAGLAYSAGLPLLVFHHLTVTRGIFDRGVLNAFLHCIDLTSSNWSMQPAINGAIGKWKDSVAAGRSNYGGSSQQEARSVDKPSCPNCSTVQKKTYMRPIPEPFSKIAGGTWECAQCGYVE